MMKNSISKRDWETISAYLDRQLSQRDQARFESRLYSDRQLQAALDDLRQTRQVLRGTPRLRAPRNFLLTPEIAGNPVRFPRLAPVFGWASAVASFLLVLVLVGDFFTDGGFAPVDLITSQQNEFIFQRSEISESDVWPQSAISEDMSMSSKSIVESTEEAAPPEIRAEVAPMDTAGFELTMESAVLEEEPLEGAQESELRAVENAAADEEPVPENPEGNEATIREGESVNDMPSETPVDSSDEGLDEPQEAAEVMVQSSIELTEDAASDPVATNAFQESPAATGEIEELPVQGMVGELEQPTGTEAESAMIADEKNFQEVPLTDHESDTTIAIEPMPGDTVAELEIMPGTLSVPKNESDWVIGVEVILAMGALGTGLAWIYTRRRAG